MTEGETEVKDEAAEDVEADGFGETDETDDVADLTDEVVDSDEGKTVMVITDVGACINRVTQGGGTVPVTQGGGPEPQGGPPAEDILGFREYVSVNQFFSKLKL